MNSNEHRNEFLIEFSVQFHVILVLNGQQEYKS